MGEVYSYCDCKNRDTRTEENLYSCKIKPNKQLFFRNNNNCMKSLSTISKTKATTIDRNNAVNLIIKNYKIYKEKKNNMKNKLNTKIKYDNKLIKKDSDIEHNYSSCLSNNSNLKKMKSLENKNTIYIGKKNQKGLKEGLGITIWNNNSKFIGIYKNNKAEGYGVFIDGIDKYKGEFKNDSANGFGIYQHGDEITYIGSWIDDLEENYGIEKWNDGSVYEGEYSQGKKHGIGTYIWADGSRYEGNWIENIQEGYGIMYYNKEKIYIGEWKNNIKEGFGELILENKKYIGFFSKDKEDGFGICYWNKINKAYVGFWKNGKQLGFGKFMTRDKRKYGMWSNDNQVNWFKNEEEALEYLEYQGLKSYKTIFLFSLDDIRNYSINNDDFNELLK